MTKEERNTYYKNFIDSYLKNPEPIKSISKKWHIKPDTIQNLFKKYNIKNYADLQKNKLNQLLKQITIDYIQNKISISTLSKKYNINRKTIVKYFLKNNIEIINTKANFCTVFDSINTEEKAYWLGFLYADGFITTKGYSVGLSLSLKDKDHLEKFRKFLNCKSNISTIKSKNFKGLSETRKDGSSIYMVSLQTCDKHLWNSLNNLGCVPKKSLILKFPDKNIFSKENLIYDFIRGYCDGDGSFGVYPHSKKDPEKNKQTSLNFIGTKEFLEGIENYLGKGFLKQKVNCNKNTYKLQYSGNKADSALNLMYSKASIYLDRKYNIFINNVPRLIG